MKSKLLVGTCVLTVWMSACEGQNSFGEGDAGDGGVDAAGLEVGEVSDAGRATRDSGAGSHADDGGTSTGSLDATGVWSYDASVDASADHGSVDSGTSVGSTPSHTLGDGGAPDENFETDTSTSRADAGSTSESGAESESTTIDASTATASASGESVDDHENSDFMTSNNHADSSEDDESTHDASSSGVSQSTDHPDSGLGTTSNPPQTSSASGTTESALDAGATEDTEQTPEVTDAASTSDTTSSVVLGTDGGTVDAFVDGGSSTIPGDGGETDASTAEAGIAVMNDAGVSYDASIDVSVGELDAGADGSIDSVTSSGEDASILVGDSGIDVTEAASDAGDGSATLGTSTDSAVSQSATTESPSSSTGVTVGLDGDAGEGGVDSGVDDASVDDGGVDDGSTDAAVTTPDDAAIDAAVTNTGESSTEAPSLDSGVSDADDAGTSESTDSGSTEVPPLDGRQLFEEEQFGGNGRTCSTCHTAVTGTITPDQIQELYDTDPTGPMFRTIDSNDGVGSDYSQLLSRATFRVEIDLPAGVTLVSDPSATSVVFRRSVPSTINTPGLDPTLMWDGRAEDLFEQATGAIMGHAEATVAPTTEQLELIAEFEQTDPFFSSDVLRDYYEGGPAPQWPPGNTAAEQRGRRWFAEDRTNAPRFNICGQCHGGPMTNTTQQNSGLPVGEHFQTANVSEFNTKGNPTYQFIFPDPRNPARTVTVTTPDPGLALTTGDARDVNFFKIPTLWGVSKTAPYFHDNSALTLEELMDHYELHLATFLRRGRNWPTPHVPTAQDKADIIAYLNLL